MAKDTKKEKRAFWNGVETGLSMACGIIKERMLAQFEKLKDEEALEARHLHYLVDKRRSIEALRVKQMYKERGRKA